MFAKARALLDPTLALLAANRGSSQRRLGARLRRCARLRGGALAHRRLTMLVAARIRCAMHAATSMAPVLRSLVLVRSSLRPDLRSARCWPRFEPAPLRRSAASLRSSARRRSRSLQARHASGGSHSLRDARGNVNGTRVAFVSARALLDPTLALLAAGRGSSQRRLGAQLRRGARPRCGALARRRLAMPAVARTRFATHAASSMALVPRSSVLVLSSTRPSFYSPLTAAQASAASALGCVAALVRTAAFSLAAGSPCRQLLTLAARCTRRRPWRPCRFRQCSCSHRRDPRSARR